MALGPRKWVSFKVRGISQSSLDRVAKVNISRTGLSCLLYNVQTKEAGHSAVNDFKGL